MKTFGAAYVNLLKTSIGSGVLSFPKLFSIYGILPVVALTLLSGFFASTGLVLLATCAEPVGRTADLSRLADLTVPYLRPVVDIAVFAKCFGVTLSYLIIAQELLPPLLVTLFGARIPAVAYLAARPWLCLLLFMAAVAPLTFTARLDCLKYTSAVGLVCIVAVIVAAVLRLAGQPPAAVAARWIAPFSLAWLSGLGKFVFSFTCHQNVFAVHAEMENNSLPRMRRLIRWVASSAFVLYLSFGLTNYMLYGAAVSDNVLNNYPQDYLAAVVRGLYVVVMGVSYPLQIVPARRYLLRALRLSATKSAPNMWLAVALLVATYALAATGAQLGLVYSLVGATASTLMCLILPTVYYLHMPGARSLRLIVVGYCAFLFGVLVFVATLIGIIARK